MKVESLGSNIHRISHEVASTHTSTYLLLSDVHYDSLSCDRKLLKKHLDQAKEHNAQVLIFGDWFDVMGCYGDPRSKSNEIRQDYMSKDFSYLDMVIEDSIEFLQPYPDADVLCRGHDHQKWHDPSTTRVRLSHQYAQYKDSVHYIKTGSYKDGFAQGEGGFEVEKNFMPVKLGGWWMHLTFDRKKGSTIKVTEAE